MKKLLVTAIAGSMLTAHAGLAQNAAGVTPVGTMLLAFDGRAATPASVQAQVAHAAERRYAYRYAPTSSIARYNPLGIAWSLRFATVEDPTTHVRWLRDVQVVLLQNTDMQCTAITTDLVVGPEKISRPSDPVRSGMMVTVTVRCTRPRDAYLSSCGGALIADGTFPSGCNPTPITPP